MMGGRIMSKYDNYIIGGGILVLLTTLIVLSKEKIHILYEALAILFGVYFIIYGLTTAKGINKYIFTIFGAGNIMIDGYLLLLNYGVLK